MTFLAYLSLIIFIGIITGKTNVDEFSINQIITFMTLLIIGMLYDIKSEITKGLKR